jgi:hypothetical protein
MTVLMDTSSTEANASLLAQTTPSDHQITELALLPALLDNSLQKPTNNATTDAHSIPSLMEANVSPLALLVPSNHSTMLNVLANALLDTSPTRLEMLAMPIAQETSSSMELIALMLAQLELFYMETEETVSLLVPLINTWYLLIALASIVAHSTITPQEIPAPLLPSLK